jgi:hypothetical protein
MQGFHKQEVHASEEQRVKSKRKRESKMNKTDEI